jgi:serine/threonine-protein kinase
VIEDVFEIQSDIASRVVDQLGVSLGGSEREEVEARPTENLEAYQAYLRGLDYLTIYSWDRGDFEAAIKLFERAVELDPEFVLAYCWSARAHLLIHWGVEPSHERVARAKAAAERALALAPDHPEAHLAMGYYHYYGLYDLGAALTEFEAAWAKRPNDPRVLSAIAFIDRRQGRWEEALEKFRTALTLDPLLARRVYRVGMTLRALRRFEEAQGSFERAITLAPDEVMAYGRLAATHWAQGNLKQARAALEAMPRQDTAAAIDYWFTQEVFERNYSEALERLSSAPEMLWGDMPRALHEGHIFQLLGDPARSRAAYEVARHQLEELLKQEPPRSWWAYCYLGEALAGLGRKDEALRAATRASELFPISKDAWAGPLLAICIASVYTSAGEYEAVLDQLEHLLPMPGVEIWYFWHDPRWDPLRDHPRFQALLEKYGQEGE